MVFILGRGVCSQLAYIISLAIGSIVGFFKHSNRANISFG